VKQLRVKLAPIFVLLIIQNGSSAILSGSYKKLFPMKNLSLLIVLFLSINFIANTATAQTTGEKPACCAKKTACTKTADTEKSATATSCSSTTKAACASKSACTKTAATTDAATAQTVAQTSETTKVNCNPANCDPKNCDPANCPPACLEKCKAAKAAAVNNEGAATAQLVNQTAETTKANCNPANCDPKICNPANCPPACLEKCKKAKAAVNNETPAEKTEDKKI
jgi:hypothetical protein